jgi:hypothetical protein
VTGKGVADHWVAVVVLVAWFAAGAFAAVRWFRWE